MVTNVHECIGAWARGQLLIAVVFGALMGVRLRALGVPYTWSLGVVAGTLEVVPYVGGAITVLLINVESHILAPVLYGRALGLSPVAIPLALIAGVEPLRIVGVLVAIPLAIIAWAITEEFAPDPK